MSSDRLSVTSFPHAATNKIISIDIPIIIKFFYLIHFSPPVSFFVQISFHIQFCLCKVNINNGSYIYG